MKVSNKHHVLSQREIPKKPTMKNFYFPLSSIVFIMISSFPKKSLFIEVETTYSSLLGMLRVIAGLAKAITCGKIQPSHQIVKYSRDMGNTGNFI